VQNLFVSQVPKKRPIARRAPGRRSKQESSDDDDDDDEEGDSCSASPCLHPLGELMITL